MSVENSTVSPPTVDVIDAAESSVRSVRTNAVKSHGIFQWRVGDQTGDAADVPYIDDSNPSTDPSVLRSTVVHSDTCPQTVADLIAEYVADTILRIDPEAEVDIKVLVKLDLIVVSGEALCSHPAKGAIVYSDQFLSTLNTSIRELLKNVGITPVQFPMPVTSVVANSGALVTSPRNATATGTTPGTHSVSQMLGNDLASVEENFANTNATNSSQDSNHGLIDDYIDPLSCQIILTVTPAVSGSAMDLPCTTVIESCSSQFLLETHARDIANKIQRDIAGSGNKNTVRAVVVELEWSEHIDSPNHMRIHSVNVSFYANNVALVVEDLVKNGIFESSNLLSLSQSISPNTIVNVKLANRLRSTAVSRATVGKQFGHPLRYGPIVAKLEALNLVKEIEGFGSKYSECKVQMSFGSTISDWKSVIEPKDVVVYVKAPGGGLVTNSSDFAQIVKNRCKNRTLDDVRKDVFKTGANVIDFFQTNHGGSSCATEFID